MDVRMLGFDGPLLSTLQHLIDVPEDVEKAMGAPTRTYVRDAKAMASTPADVKELPDAYVFVVDMPGLRPTDVKVQVEDDRVLVVSGERKRQEEEGNAKYLRMERRVGKFMRKFALPDNADVNAVSAVCQDGVLSVTVKKVPPPEPKKPKVVEVKGIGGVREKEGGIWVFGHIKGFGSFKEHCSRMRRGLVRGFWPVAIALFLPPSSPALTPDGDCRRFPSLPRDSAVGLLPLATPLSDFFSSSRLCCGTSLPHDSAVGLLPLEIPLSDFFSSSRRRRQIDRPQAPTPLCGLALRGRYEIDEGGGSRSAVDTTSQTLGQIDS
ncbi:hypothetical protein ZIOFF_041492 [Zingiber officinale]|uniref:SHSP domain-containing protein n=1 Tax=Zingiber officinale TaxID=94328 RepID=A0A8J5KYU2_ZINOF|nr:hypothetical protein ZIOFF_041492 [Zingiber officinale]